MFTSGRVIVRRLDPRGEAEPNRDPRVLLAGPPLDAIGGVATHSRLLVDHLAGVTPFDQWSGSSAKVTSRSGRAVMHARALRRWIATLRSRDFDVVHLQMTRPGIVRDMAYLLLAWSARMPVVAYVHSSVFFEGSRATLADRLLMLTVPLSRTVVVLSDLQYETLRGRHERRADRIVRLRNPVPELEEPAPGAARSSTSLQGPQAQVLCVAEISSAKGQAQLAEAVQQLRQSGRRVILVLAGPWGPIADQDKSMLEAADFVDLRGVLRGADKTRAYDEATVFALFSKSEAQPLCVLEAMSRGLPVVATNTGAVAEMISPVPGNGLVDIGDTNGLLRHLERLLDDPASAQRTGARNRDRVRESFSSEQHLTAVAQVYRRVSGQLLTSRR